MRWLGLWVVMVAMGVGVVTAPAALASGWAPSQPLAAPPEANGQLSAVACPSATACAAVGSFHAEDGSTQAFAESWDGSGWTLLPAPVAPAGAVDVSLASVSCVAADACVAVGYYTIASGDTVALAENWDGVGWTIHGLVVPPLYGPTRLSGVSCSAADACTAVGGGLAERWDGTAWSLQSIPEPGPLVGLNGVSCPSASSCVAVGGSEAGGLIARWDGTSWSIEPGDVSAGSLELTAVSCTSVSGCMAVGFTTPQSSGVAEHWDGTSWTSVPLPAGIEQPTSVSCASPTACVAEGSGTSAVSVLAAWDGTTWSQTGQSDGGLDSVSCAVADACWAVGRNGNQTLAEHWDGTAWQTEATAEPVGGAYAFMFDISCSSVTACTAVGHYDTASWTQATLAERWDGTAWSVQPTPAPPDVSNALWSYLRSVSCPTSSQCVAVGLQGAWVEVWDGSSWSLEAVPSPPGATPDEFGLDAISCPAANDCIAIGGTASSTVDERWDGTSWTLDAMDPGLLGVGAISCPTTTFCLGVGDAQGATAPTVPFAEEWDGTGWSATPLPPAPADVTASGLSSVSCTAPDACTAVGSSSGAFGPENPTQLVERWDGARWTIQPTLADESYAPAGVSCATATACAAVGGETGAGWDGTSWSSQTLSRPPDDYSDAATAVSCVTATWCIGVGDDLLAWQYSGAAPSSPPGSAPARTSPQPVLPAPSAMSPSAIRARLLAEITPRGAADEACWLLRHGGTSLAFAAPTAGAVVLGWYLPPRAARKPYRLIAAGHGTFASAAKASLAVRLTAQGKRLLRHATRLQAIAVAEFVPAGASAVGATKRFTFRR